MDSVQIVKNHIENFQNQYLKDSVNIEVNSKLFDIYSEEDWSDSFPDATKAGVYVIFSKNMDVVYVGESVLLGKRLSDHFPGSVKSGVKLKEGYWENDPQFILTASVSPEFFRIPLEVYLINEINEDWTLENVKTV